MHRRSRRQQVEMYFRRASIDNLSDMTLSEHLASLNIEANLRSMAPQCWHLME